jgi:hypothetical protein
MLIIALTIMVITPAVCANVELVGKPLVTKIEGEIEPGDALKFLRLYKYYGPFLASEVLLFSPGGDFEESIKIGKLIRRFRLETTAPDRRDLPAPDHPKGWSTTKHWISPASADNSMCASACVLIYAGGAKRRGDALILHRPYVPRETADTLSDVEYERTENQAMLTARKYLDEMGMPEYYVDKLVMTSSHEGYLPSEGDLLDHPLVEIPPAIQEIILSKCDNLDSTVSQQNLSYLLKNRVSQNVLHNMLRREDDAWFCEEEQLQNLRIAAWIRESAVSANSECSTMTVPPISVRIPLRENNVQTLNKAIDDSQLILLRHDDPR